MYTVSWKEGHRLNERTLSLRPSTLFLSYLRAPATVVDETGQVCGEVRYLVGPGEPMERWRWHLELTH